VTTALATRRARTPALDRTTAHRLMTEEYARVVDQLRSLTPDQWRTETCNTGWDVRALAAHMLGMLAMASSLREMLRQTREAKRRGGEQLDALTALQVEMYDGWTPERITTEYARLAPKAVRGRTRMPGLMRGRPVPGDQPVAPGQYEPWAFAFLLDVILTRDPWMHRTDIAVATGAPLVLTPEHDGVIVDDVVNEWAHRHGEACTLELTGPLARTYRFGAGDGPSYTVDAVELCRILSGRGEGEGLLRTRVPF
jgi:uncharacterized protein (TIGR03083 family)